MDCGLSLLSGKDPTDNNGISSANFIARASFSCKVNSSFLIIS